MWVSKKNIVVNQARPGKNVTQNLDDKIAAATYEDHVKTNEFQAKCTHFGGEKMPHFRKFHIVYIVICKCMC